MQSINFRLTHTYRENNMVANFLVNLGCDLRSYVVFNKGNIPRKLKGIVRIDGCGLPSIRHIKM